MIIISVLVVVIAAIAVPFAEFTKSSRAKRVVATYLDSGALFSSNYLVANNNTAANVYKRFFYTNDIGTGAVGTVTVCNYPQGNLGVHYDKNVSYRLTAKLVKISESYGVVSKRDALAAEVGTKTATLTFKGGTPVTLSASDMSYDFGLSTLSCLAASTDLIDISFSADFNDNADGICLYLCASPEPAVSSLFTVDAVFLPTLSVQETKNNWEGEFNDDMTKSITGFDGYNYAITGTGKGNCKLKWRSDKLRISQVFLNEIGVATGSETSGGFTWNTLIFPVDSDTVNRYDLQFYNADNVTFSSWQELAGTTGGTPATGYVILEFNESTD